MQVTITEVRRLETFNNTVLDQLVRQIMQAQRSFGGASPERVRDELLRIAPALADQYSQAMMTGAAEWYEALRRAEVGGTYMARLGAGPDPLAVEKNVRFAAGSLFEGDPQATFRIVRTALERHVLNSSRDTIILNTERDPQAAGWHRIARADSCNFCVMLSQRGAIYKRRSADFAAHDNCRCRIAPSWDPSAPEVNVRAYEASKRTSSMTASQKEAHNQRVKQWMKQYEDDLDSFRAELTD